MFGWILPVDLPPTRSRSEAAISSTRSLFHRIEGEIETTKRSFLNARIPFTVPTPQLARSALQHIDCRQRDRSRGPHAAVAFSVLTGEGVVLRALPDALQLGVSHRRHTLHELLLVVSQQAPNHCAALNMNHLPDANRHPLQADCFCLVASPAVSTEPLLSAMAQRTPAASADDVRWPDPGGSVAG